MGFRKAKRQVLECLSSGKILHEVRQHIDLKNLFSTGQISIDEVSLIIARAKGTEYQQAKHHTVKSVNFHILKTRYCGQRWYIKWYYIEPNSVFISVHH